MPELNASPAAGSSVGVALIGPGRCGKVHLKNIVSNPRMTVEWLVDINEEIPATVKQDFNLDCKIATYDSIDQALQDNRVGLIVITTPTDNHPKMIEACIKNGLAQPIFCEKPISEEPEEIEHCYKLATEANVQLMVGFNRRFDPTFRRAERMVREEAGTIQTMHAVYADAPTPPLYFLQANHESRKGIVFYDLGCHFLDLILWLLNDEMPESVYSVGHTYTPDFKSMDEPDLSMSTLYFPSGATVVLELGYSSAVGFDMRLEVRGTGGVVQADNPTVTGVQRITPEGRVYDGLESSIWERFDKSFYNQMDFMADVAEGKAEVPITAEHCVKVAKVAEAMRQSYFQKKPIYFPKPEAKEEVKTGEAAEEIYVH